MPQHCDGGELDRCRCGERKKGHRVNKQRDGPSCALCSWAALRQALRTEEGRNHLIARLRHYYRVGHRNYEAAFSALVAPGLYLTPKKQRKLRQVERKAESSSSSSSESESPTSSSPTSSDNCPDPPPRGPQTPQELIPRTPPELLPPHMLTEEEWLRDRLLREELS